MSDASRAALAAEVSRQQRDRRIAAHEAIGSALAVLHRLDHVWYDDDVRDMVTKARSTLSVAQSKVKQRIDPSIQEGATV